MREPSLPHEARRLKARVHDAVLEMAEGRRAWPFILKRVADAEAAMTDSERRRNLIIGQDNHAITGILWEMENGRNTWEDLRDPVKAEIPEHLRDGLGAYLCEKLRPGSFLIAVLSNDLMGAIGRCDFSMSIASLRNLCQLIHTHFPSNCCGSKEAVEKWLGPSDEVVGAAREFFKNMDAEIVVKVLRELPD